MTELNQRCTVTKILNSMPLPFPTLQLNALDGKTIRSWIMHRKRLLSAKKWRNVKKDSRKLLGLNKDA